MRDGLYKVYFRTPHGEGTGVAYLHAGKVRGGDSTQYYTGNYTVDGDKFTANIVSSKHSSYPGVSSVLGADTAHVSMSGVIQGDNATATASALHVPGNYFQAELSRIAD